MARGVRVGKRNHRRMLHRVSLERLVETVDLAGQPENRWELVEEAIPAHVESVGGGERTRGVQIEAGTSYLVELRYRSDLSAKYRFKHEDSYLYILSIRDPEGLRRRTLCQCGSKEGDI